ncbi:MAG: prenyltransferase/squalene oxidase repeat-containing protein, partial [Sedimentisphaerales bacterium]
RHLGLIDKQVIDAVMAGLDWLLGLQNRDGGIPTFCRGWTALPFDRSAPDLTAHTIGAISAWLDVVPISMHKRMVKAITSGLTYLKRVQNQDGSWVPLWFGNQFAPNQENPLYGTARVLTALCGSTTGGFNPAINCVTEPPVKLGAKYSIHLAPRFTWGPCFTRVSRFTRGYAPMINKAVRWLLSAQNQDGGWGRAKSTIEETALAVDALAELMLCGSLKRSLGMDYFRSAISRGVSWLIEQTKQGTSVTASPIGLYFARLWYFEELYPVIFTVSALQKVQSILATDFTDFTEIHNKNY